MVCAGETALSGDSKLVDGGVLQKVIRDAEHLSIYMKSYPRAAFWEGTHCASLLNALDDLGLVFKLWNLAADETENDGLALGQEA